MTVTLSAGQWVNEAVNIVLPTLVALVTARVASPSVKAVTLLVLSAISGVLTSYLAAISAGAPWDLASVSTTTLFGFITAVAAHFGLTKQLNSIIQAALPGGLGNSTVGAPKAVGDDDSGRRDFDG